MLAVWGGRCTRADPYINAYTPADQQVLGTLAALTSHLRVCSVLPSATEILCFVGGEHLLVGRSHEDNYPASVQRLVPAAGSSSRVTLSPR